MRYTRLITAFVGLLFASTASATPPSCFLSCISEVSRTCPQNHHDVSCICDKHLDVVGCLVDICPYGTFESARDHFWGTCLEHDQHTTPIPPPYNSPHDDSDNHVPYPNPNYQEPEHPSEPEVPQPVEPAPQKPFPEYPEYPQYPSYPDETNDNQESDHDDDYDTECDDKDDQDNEFDDDRHIVEDESDCEWEEEETVGSDGEVNIIRRPINVSDKHRKQPTTEPIRKKVIIKRPIKDRKNVELAGSYGNSDRYYQ